MSKFYVHHNSHSWFVKTEEMFIRQGGLTNTWGNVWRLIEADNLEDAVRTAEFTKPPAEEPTDQQVVKATALHPYGASSVIKPEWVERRQWVTVIWGDHLFVTQTGEYEFVWSFDYNGNYTGKATSQEGAQKTCKDEYLRVADLVTDVIENLKG